MIIIADIAGQFDALMRLVNRFPGESFCLVGDLMDRGPKSKEVIEWAIANRSRVTALLGNHEHMMISHLLETHHYQYGLWLFNGGKETLASYQQAPPDHHIEWLKRLPLYKMVDNCLITHAPLSPDLELSDLESQHPMSPTFNLLTIWNRETPKKRPYFQIFGHNSHWGLLPISEEGDDGAYALCIDQSRKRILTAVHWPSMEVIEEPYDLPASKDSEVPLKELDL